MRRIEMVLLALGVLSLVVFAFPELGVIAAITVIGLPLALAYWVTPAVFVFALTAYLLHRPLRLSGKTGVVVSSLVAAVVLAMPSYLLNGPIHREAASWAAGDLDKLRLPITARSIASRERFKFPKGTTPCGGFCLHSLLTGAAERFLVADSDRPHGDISLNEEVIAFRLERRDVCPPVNFRSGAHRLTFPFAKGDTARAADPVETLKLRASNGECLVSEPATLGEADIVVSRGKATDGVFRHRDTGFSLTADTVVADRISLHQKTAGNRFDEVYRHTQVRYRPFGWLLVPAVTMRGDLNGKVGWWRKESRINVQSRHSDPYERTAFLVGKLGLDLKLEGEDTKRQTLAKLRKLLDDETPPSPADWALFSQYFDRIGIGRNARMSRDDFELGLRMLDNEDYPTPPRPHNLVKYAARNANDAEMARLAGLLVGRLNKDAQQHQALGANAEEQVKHLASAVHRLPDAALLPHRDEMVSLAARADVRRNGYVALQRLAVYGEDAVPTLLALMKAGLEGGERFYRDNRFQHPYLGGLQGLCRAGANAASALQELRQLTVAAKLPDHGPYGRLLFTTLLRLGEDKEQVRAMFVAAARNKANATDKHFDSLAARAMKAKPRCHF